ncbi:MAG TPA: OmpA family protein [Chitinophagaceae bacterium]|nr:OmpA family protein [Chitinophagaceae bacterium]
MKKSLLFLLTLWSIHFSSYSQVRVRLIGGPQQSIIKETNSVPGWDTTVNRYNKKRNTFHAGILADIPFKTNSKLFFQSGVIFSSKGRTFDKVYDTLTEANYRIRINKIVNYFEIPINIGLKFPLFKNTKFVVATGTYAGLFFSGKSITETTTKDLNFIKEEVKFGSGNGVDKFKSLDLGLNASAGFDFGGITLTARYTRSIVNSFTASYSGTFKHEVMGASLGINLKTITDKKNKPAIKDEDNDGIDDKLDECPDIAGTIKGCPDMDKDSIADKDDKCPDVAGIAKYNGCPIPDSDQDGVNDEIDKCPNISGLAQYNGCPPPDSDKDGIPDNEDKCPGVIGVIQYNGCPIPDSDRDGVNDEEDKCPTIPGLKAHKGCPGIKTEIRKKIREAAKKVYFDFASSIIKPESYKVLDEVAKILNENPELRLIIEGHTDNIGTLERNRIRSQERADAIRMYLQLKKVAGSRIKAIGYGFRRPIADNKTEKGRAQNRRVEMKLSY